MSELYASMLMIGVTLTLGSVVVAAALGSAGQADGSASLGSSVQEQAAGAQLALAYAAVTSPGSCPSYQGVSEGTTLSVSVYDFGTAGFTPSEIVVNSTAYSGPFLTVPAGSLGSYALTLGSCAHSSGLVMFLSDAKGDEFQFES